MTKRKRLLRRALVQRLMQSGIENHGLAHTEVGYWLNRCSEAMVVVAIRNCPPVDPLGWLKERLG